MATEADLLAAVAKLRTDISQAIKDLIAKIGTAPVSQATLDSVVNDLQAIDASVVAADPGDGSTPAPTV